MARDLNGEEVTSGRLGDLIKVANQCPIPGSAESYNHLRVQLASGKEVSLLFTDNDIEVAYERALKNHEDIPPVSWIRNLLD